MVKSWKLPLRSVTKEECLLSSLLFNLVLKVLPTAIRQKKKKNWKGRKKTVIFANDTYVCACMLRHFSHVWQFVPLWTAARQAPLSLWFSRQEYWSGLPCSTPDLPNSGIEPTFPVVLNCRNSLLLSHWGSLILYIENPKDSYKKLLELINEFSKDAEHKINTNKNVMWSYSNNKLSEKIKETISFTITLKLIK